MITVDARYVFALARVDADAEAGESFDALVSQSIDRLRVALRARAEQRESRVLLRGLAEAGPAPLLFAAFAWLLTRARNWIANWATTVAKGRLQNIPGLGFDVRRQAAVALRMLTNGVAWVWMASIGYLWLTVCFSAFPYTEPWGDQLGRFLRNTPLEIGRGIVDAVPSLVVIAVIVLITRAAVGVVNGFFRNVERGWTRVSWLDAHTARATRRLVDVILWLFALTAAYPHIPGSHTEAFRGISVFLGVVVSLGSTGVVNQVMSGFVVVYSRALRTGDWVHVGEIEGRVTDIGMLTTRLSTVRREEVAIPNAVLVASSTTNFTSLAGADGPLISTALAIGYDVPWRQVHALLELAASRTSGIRAKPEPRVLQRGLSDFYVEYQLIAHLERAEERFEVLSQLHTSIQDAFNEQGVQIMSPHFAVQPGHPVVVPEAKWFAPPAQREPAGA